MMELRQFIRVLIMGLSLGLVAYCAGRAMAQQHVQWWGP
jgi:hypothetical protein